jgi:uncharacterized membrane protein required for colicin V production
MVKKKIIILFVSIYTITFCLFFTLSNNKIERLKQQNIILKEKLNTQKSFNIELLKHKFGLKFQTKGKMNDTTTRSNKGKG